MTNPLTMFFLIVKIRANFHFCVNILWENDERIINYSALNRNLDIPCKKYVPFYEHRPVDTTQEYLEDPVEYSNSFNKSDK